jgi:hypothetical protein
MFQAFSTYKKYFEIALKDMAYNYFLNGDKKIISVIRIYFRLSNNDCLIVTNIFNLVQLKIIQHKEFLIYDEIEKHILLSNIESNNLFFLNLLYFLLMAFGLYSHAVHFRACYIVTSDAWPPMRRSFIDDNNILDKNVAIVCPGDNFLDSGAEINNFDYVIRVGDQRPIISKSTAKLGNKWNAVVLNYEAALKIKNGMGGDLLDLPKIFFKESISNLNLDFIEQKEFMVKLKFSVIGHPNLLQIIFNHVMACSPKSVKIFNANMFISDNKYISGYSSSSESKKIEDLTTCKMLSSHDPFSNFEYLKNMSSIYSSVVTCDYVLNDILDLNLHQYAQRLTRRYSFC